VFAQHRRLRSRPGRGAYYSNLGYLLLEALVEVVSGSSFDAYVRENILEPAGMGDTGFAHDPALATRTATGHEPLVHPRTIGLAVAIPSARKLVAGPAGRFLRLRPFALDGRGYGALLGPIRDLVSLGQLHLRGGEARGARVLSEATTHAMRLPRASDGNNSFGQAWWLGREGERTFLQHGGGAGGFRSELRLYPEHDLGLAVLANGGGTDTMRLIDHLAAVMR
jgi:CubicO group peptidase (beta-lactamase class C family)